MPFDSVPCPILSVIIPVLNNVKQFSTLIETLISYDNHKIEIIVIDGGSDDGTVDAIKKHENSITYWETGLDKGIADAFNRGIEQAQGQLIAILNSDDYWDDNTLDYILSAFKEKPDADIYYGDLRFVDEEKSESYIKKPNLKRMKYRMNIFHPAMFITQKAYQKIGVYRLDYHYAMDSEWCHRALESELNFYYIPHVLTSMRLGGVSDLHFKKSISEYRKSVVFHHLTSSIEAGIYFYFFLFMRYLMNNRLVWKIVRVLTK
ncbi:MAG: glycosyltransferase [gamma proteobacterium symbiont of Taylorina sp.]|nr:glycosyltransferase [gamma proteobacterium symbiont of Taylorina sp.]